MTSEPNDRRDRGDSSGPNGVAEFAEVAEVAGSFARSFPAVYLRFHRRDEKSSQLPTASRAVLQHLALCGPITVGELCDHLERAQSVVSDIVAHLEQKGLVERQDRPRRPEAPVGLAVALWPQLSPAGTRDPVGRAAPVRRREDGSR